MRTSTLTPWVTPPALLLAAGWGLGIGIASVWPEAGTGVWAGIAGGAIGVAAGGHWWRSRRIISLAPLATTVALGVAVVAAGGTWYRVDQQLPGRHLAHFISPDSEIDFLVRGRVVGSPDRDERGVRFTLRAQHIVRESDTLRIGGAIRVGLWTAPWDSAGYPTVYQGDIVRLHGALEVPPPRLNPADFDYAAYLRRRGVYTVMNVYAPRDVEVIRRARSWWIRATVAVRRHIRRQLRRWVSSRPSRRVLQALLLGDRSAIGTETEKHFARTGLMHLLAVSGLHVLLVGMVLYGLLRPLLARLRLRWRTVEIARAAATMVVLVFFMGLTGMRPSVVRAVVMAGLFIGGAFLQRPTYPLNTLGVAALLLLIARPAALFDVGFQLSFAAVGAIVLLVPRMRAFIPESWLRRQLVERPLMLVVVSLAATLGTAPILAHHFGYVPLAGLVLNVLAIPLTALSMVAGLSTVLFGGWMDAVAAAFGSAASVLSSGLLQTAEFGHSALGWALVAPSSSWPVLVVVALAGVASQWAVPRWRWRLLAFALFLTAAGVWHGILHDGGRPRLGILFFSVGHGDAALVSFPNGRHLLVDAGPRTPFSDAARRTIIPHLRRYGISQLDAVVVTHADSDHLGGLPALLRSTNVKRVVHGGRSASTSLYREVVDLMDSLSVPHRAVQAGDTLSIDPSVRVRVLAPFRRVQSENNASVVLHLAYGSKRILLTGDIEASVERVLVRCYEGLASHVVKVPHHGSETSSTVPFVQEVVGGSSEGAVKAVVSVGRNGRFGLPSPEVVHRWRSEGADVRLTARGAVWIEVDGSSISEVEWW